MIIWTMIPRTRNSHKFVKRPFLLGRWAQPGRAPLGIMEWLREDGGQREGQSPQVTWQDRDDIVPTRSETLARTFNSERAKMASPLPTGGSPIWESKNVPNTPLDAAKEQRYRDEVVRMLRGDSEVPPSPLQQAASGQKSTGGSERVSREVYDAALKRAVDQASSEERSGKGMPQSQSCPQSTLVAVYASDAGPT